VNFLTNASQLFRALSVALVAACFKLVHANQVRASALFADDYDGLNRAIYYWSDGIRASLESYPFHQASAGLSYFYYVSPWILFPVEQRMFVVFCLNALLTMVMIVFGSLAIADFRGKSSWSVPLVLATFATCYQFNFYVMTENMLFPLLALAFWLTVDIVKTARMPGRLFVLALTAALLPLTRQPGFAAVVGILAVLAVQIPRIGLKRAASVGVLTLLAAVVPYLWYTSLFGVSRELQYVNSIQSVASKPENWVFTFKLALAQVGYLFFSTGVWLLPFFLVGLFRAREFPEQLKTRWLSISTFITVSAILFSGLCLVHLTFKLLVHGRYEDPSPWFIYGRYNDPASLLLLFGGLAALFELPLLKGKKTWAFFLSIPILFYGVRACLEHYNWIPINQAGLTIFYLKFYQKLPLWFPYAWLLLVLVTAFLAFRPKFRVPLVIIHLLIFNVMSIQHGMAYTIRRAMKVERSMVAAYWIADHTPSDSLICYDFSVRTKRVPDGIKRMSSKFKAMMFKTYPRKFRGLNKGDDYGACQYFYTLRSALPETGFRPVWQNKYYVLAELDAKS